MAVWFMCAIGASFLWSVANIIDKLLISRYAVTPVAYVCMDAAFGLVPVVIILLTGHRIVVSQESVILGLFTGFAVSLFSLLYSMALKFGDLFLVSIFIQLVPLGTIFIGLFFFDERYSWLAYSGIVITIGVSMWAARLGNSSGGGKSDLLPNLSFHL